MICKTCGRPIIRRTPEELATPDPKGLYPGEYAHHQPGGLNGGYLYPSRDGHAPDPGVEE